MKEQNCIILIIAHKPELDRAEVYSLRRCQEVLGKYKIVIVCPIGMNITNYIDQCPSLHFDFINPMWQATYQAFNKLKIHPFLYNRYKTYKYILFYELDTLVFRDELDYWCKQDYDYIGAPWFEKYSKTKFVGIGNGGFSLRKVSSILRVTQSFRYLKPPKELFESLTFDQSFFLKLVNLISQLTIVNNSHHPFNNYVGPEDVYWGKIIPSRFSWFKVPTPETALQFSFERHPRILYEKNNYKLPFGCHAWQKYDADFYLELFPELEAVVNFVN